MKLLRRLKPPVPYKYVVLTAIVFSVAVIFQSSQNNSSGEINIQIKHIAIFVINYSVWVFIIDWVAGLTSQINHLSLRAYKKLFVSVLNFVLLILAHLIISNILYATFLFLVSNVSVDQSILNLLTIIDRALISRAIDLVVILVLFQAVTTYRLLQQRKFQLVELENELHKTQLDALKSQLNPHFLFNSLHALHSLIGHDDSKAKSMVIKISSLLRKVLDRQDEQTVILQDELEFLNDYLDIEQERFHDRLHVKIDVEEEARKFIVPVLTLQPLAENAFKHGISQIEGNGIVHLTCSIVEDELIIEMSNSIPLESNKIKVHSTGLGLRNLRTRLEKNYGDNFNLKTTRTNEIYTVEIRIKN